MNKVDLEDVVMIAFATVLFSISVFILSGVVYTAMFMFGAL